MKFRLQYSLLTMLAMTAVCSIVAAYFVIPWRYHAEQMELHEKLKIYHHGVYNILGDARHDPEAKTYIFEYYGAVPKYLDYFLELAPKCDLIHEVTLKSDHFTTDQLDKLRLLPHLDSLILKDCDIDEARMRVIGKMPLKKLQLRVGNKADFQTWPIQPTLEWMSWEAAHKAEFFPLQIIGHQKLQELSLQGLPKVLKLENCPELKEVNIGYPFENNPIELHLQDLPKLESLSLGYGIPLQPESRVEELPALRELVVDASAFKYFQHLELSQLRKLSCLMGCTTTLNKEAVEKILKLSEIQALSLEADWRDCINKSLRVPLMPKLTYLQLESFSVDGTWILPDELVIQFLRQSPSLISLRLYVENLSNQLIAEIAKHEKLEGLYLQTRDTGKIGDLSLLRKRKLSSLYLNYQNKNLPEPAPETSVTP